MLSFLTAFSRMAIFVVSPTADDPKIRKKTLKIASLSVLNNSSRRTSTFDGRVPLEPVQVLFQRLVSTTRRKNSLSYEFESFNEPGFLVVGEVIRRRCDEFHVHIKWGEVVALAREDFEDGFVLGTHKFAPNERCAGVHKTHLLEER
jgi:hypothetical protein